jgi:hypothetical protein
MNVHGKASHSIMLREARPPGPLLQVKFQTITGKDAALKSLTFLLVLIFFVCSLTCNPSLSAGRNQEPITRKPHASSNYLIFIGLLFQYPAALISGYLQLLIGK